MANCPDCGKENPEQAKRCVHCWFVFNRPPRALSVHAVASAVLSGLSLAMLLAIGILQPLDLSFFDALLLSLLVFVLWLFGLSTGITALIRIRHQFSQLRGAQAATGGIAVSLCALLLACFLIPRFLQLQADLESRQKLCTYNAAHLLRAIHMYSVENDGRLPSAENWCDSVLPYTSVEDAFLCPHDSNPLRPQDGNYSSYAFNAALSGRAYDSLKDRLYTILIFDSGRGWNAAGGAELLPAEPRHLGKDVYGFANVYAQAISRKQRPGPEYWEPE